MTDDEFKSLWIPDDIPICPEGMALLKVFFDTYPTIYQFVQPQDFTDLTNEAFAGMPEWEAYSDHCNLCGHCNQNEV